MQVHTMLFVTEHGHAVGSYPVLDGEETAEFLTRMKARYKFANENPACIAAFWWRGATMVEFQFNRA